MGSRKILIVGGGITGTSAAIMLAKSGHSVELVEIDQDWRALGAGITVLGSTLRALSHLDVLDEVMETGYFRSGNNMYRYTGELLSTRPGMVMPDADLPGGGGILRPALHGILSRKALACGVNVRLGVTYDSIDNDEDGVTVHFTDGNSERYDLLIGADGLKSPLRQRLFPDAPKPAFSGQGAWRLVADRPPEIDRSSFYIGAPVTVGTVPVSQAQMYVWVLEHVPHNPWYEPDIQRQRLAELLAPFGGAVAALRDSMNESSMIVYRPLEALIMPPPWHVQRIVLMGDAVHATSPHLASGAGLGVEDAVVLAQEMDSHIAIGDALTAFTRRRYERCKAVVEGSLAIGQAEMDGQSHRINELMNSSQSAISQPF